MQITLTLALPRDQLSVPLSRKICMQSMDTLGVDDNCAHDIEVALTEACTNVLDHVAEGDQYEVRIRVDDERCVIEVIDTGAGFDHTTVNGRPPAELTAEEGRGIAIMRALVDRVTFSSRPERGTVVHLEKDLHYAAQSPVRQLAAAETASGEDGNLR